MSGPQEPAAGLVRIPYIKLAMWLKLNGQALVQRLLLPDGNLVYLFNSTPELDRLMRQWVEEPEAQRLSRFASLVSYEIRTLVRKKRALGLAPQFGAAQLEEPTARESTYPDLLEQP